MSARPMRGTLGRLLLRAIALRFDAYLYQQSNGGTRHFSRII